jgi:hypothetical protein
MRSLHTPSWVGARLHHPTSVSRTGHAGDARRRSGEELRLGCAMLRMEPKHGASHASFRRSAPRKRCVRVHSRCSASCLRARALLSANACRPAAATKMADVYAVLVRRSCRTHLHDTSLRRVRAAHRAPARSVTRYRLLGCHWAPGRRTAPSLATVPVPRRSALACRVQRQRLRMCRRAATECCTWRNRAPRRGRVHTARLRCLTSASSIATPPVRICADLASQRAAHTARCTCLTCAFGGTQVQQVHRHDAAPRT